MKRAYDPATTFTYSEVETALCLWEAVIDLRYSEAEAAKEYADRLDRLFGDHGSYTMRAAIAGLVD